VSSLDGSVARSREDASGTRREKARDRAAENGGGTLDRALRFLGGKLAEIYESSADRARILPMEGVRGFAVLLVFFVHYDALFRDWALQGGLVRRVSGFLGNVGHSGVDLFFALSGFLIYGALVSKRTPYGRFIVRRIQRIYPPYLAVFAVYVLLSFAFPSESKLPPGIAAGSIFLIENLLLLPGIFEMKPLITVAWSLSYEIFFYLSVPVVVLGLGMRDWKSEARAAFFAILAALYAVSCALDLYPRLQLIMFISGILLFESFRSIPARESHGKARARDFVGCAALLLALVLAHFTAMTAMRFEPVHGLHVDGWSLKVVVEFVCFPIFLYSVFRSNSLLGQVFSSRFFRYLGNMSYSYYLIHGLTLKFAALVLRAVVPPGPPHSGLVVAVLPVAFAATWITSTLLFTAIEKRFSLPSARR